MRGTRSKELDRWPALGSVLDSTDRSSSARVLRRGSTFRVALVGALPGVLYDGIRTK